MRIVETNSMMPTSGFSAVGTPGGQSRWPKYLRPWCLMPTQMKITQTSRLSVSGMAMRAVAGM